MNTIGKFKSAKNNVLIYNMLKITNIPKIEKGKVSIVIPIYGKFDSQRALLTVESILEQKGVNLEVVVSEQGKSPKLKEKLPKSVKYIFNQHIPSPHLSDFNPGLIRNLAIKESSGEFM